MNPPPFFVVKLLGCTTFSLSCQKAVPGLYPLSTKDLISGSNFLLPKSLSLSLILSLSLSPFPSTPLHTELLLLADITGSSSPPLSFFKPQQSASCSSPYRDPRAVSVFILAHNCL
jgi:hypothetical protein